VSQGRVARLRARGQRRLSRHPRLAGLVDHGRRAWGRAGDVLWARLAGAVTYFGFLSLFPVLALGFAILGVVAAHRPELRASVEDAVSQAFPGLVGSGPQQVSLDALATAATSAGIIGALGLLYAGTGFADALRDALHVVFGTSTQTMNIVVKKARSVVALAVVGSLLLLSAVASTLATSATSWLLRLAGLDGSTWADLALRLLGIGVGLLLDMAVLAAAFRFMSGAAPSWRAMRGGVLLGAVGLEVLKLLAGRLLVGTVSNPVYASFAVLVGLLVWINFSARVVLLAAAWVAVGDGLPLRAGAGVSPWAARESAAEPASPRPAPVAPSASSGSRRRRTVAAGAVLLGLAYVRGRRDGARSAVREGTPDRSRSG
jgi:membrane protein